MNDCEKHGPQASPLPPPEIFATLSVLSGKWKLLIIWTLFRGTVRFNSLKRSLPGLTQHILTSQLRDLEDEGIISRKIFAEVPPRVEYSLTEHGKTLGPILRTLAEWGSGHLKNSPHRKPEAVSSSNEDVRAPRVFSRPQVSRHKPNVPRVESS